MPAFNPIENNPTDSADSEAAKLLRAHVSKGIKTTPARTSAGSARSKAGQATGTRRSGGARISGGRG